MDITRTQLDKRDAKHLAGLARTFPSWLFDFTNGKVMIPASSFSLIRCLSIITCFIRLSDYTNFSTKAFTHPKYHTSVNICRTWSCYYQFSTHPSHRVSTYKSKVSWSRHLNVDWTSAQSTIAWPSTFRCYHNSRMIDLLLGADFKYLNVRLTMWGLRELCMNWLTALTLYAIFGSVWDK